LMPHPDHVIIKSLTKQFLFVKTHSQSGVVLFKVVWYCPKWCGTVQRCVVLCKVVWYCPKWCGTVQCGVVLSKVRCQAESANLHFPCDCGVHTIERGLKYSLTQVTIKYIKSES
jgi:hypothetical protein